MSNILIIKHGSLGDIAQISGVLKDIREKHKDQKILILTTLPYVELLSICPHIDGVLIDKRLPRWNIFYLLKLKKLVDKFKFTQVYDLQNSSRTSFYKKYIFKTTNWSSTETILKKGEKKSDFDNSSVLERFNAQLNLSDVNTKYTLKPDFSWARVNVDKIVNKYFGKKFILLFPFCSLHNSNKKWPYFNDLIKIIRSQNFNFEIAIAPGPNEIEEAKNINAISITNNDKALSIMELTGLIEKASFIISNDTGPAHISAHMGKTGVVIFGSHTTPNKVSIETEMFKAIKKNNIREIKAEDIFLKIKDKLKLIN